MFWIESLKVRNLRCFESYKVDFCKGINILVGKNAVGKTSLIESIYILGCCKSHRTNSDNAIKRNGTSFYSASCFVCEDENFKDEISLISTEKGKKIALNSKVFLNLSDYIGYFNVVLFCPEDLNLVKGELVLKRKFLDLGIGQLDKVYLNSLMKYKRVLKNRNEYLKQVEDDKYDMVLLNTYTEALINEAKIIISKRKMFIDELNKFFSSKVSIISGGKENGIIVYKPNVDVDNLLISYEKKIKYDLISQTTNVGPHRDTFDLLINGENCVNVASQGQQRTLALALKLSLAELIKSKTDRVIVVLDDVFGELDIERQNNLLGLIGFDCQMFITTTTIESLTKNVIENSKIIEIMKDGEVYE